MDFTIAAILAPAVIGFTESVKDQFPATKGFVPLITILVSFLVYAGYHYLSSDLFTTIYTAGAGMGLYTGAKVVGTINTAAK